VSRLSIERAKRLLTDMQEAPFVAFVFKDGDLRIYGAGLDAEDMEAVEDLVKDLQANKT